MIKIIELFNLENINSGELLDNKPNKIIILNISKTITNLQIFLQTNNIQESIKDSKNQL